MSISTHSLRISILWLTLVVCMILHFDYHISELFYGIDIKTKDANGTVPDRIIFIRSIFHFIPLIFVAVNLWITNLNWRKLQFGISILYTLAHGFHLIGELKKGNNPSQIVLLAVTFILGCFLIAASYSSFKKKNQNNS